MEKKEKEELEVPVVATEEVTVETPATAAADGSRNGAVPRDRWRAMMAEKYPEREFGSDDELDTAFADWAEEADRELTGYKESDKVLRRVGAEHPELIAIAKDLADDPKMPLTVAIARNLDVDELFPQEGDPDYDAMYKAREERMKQREEQEAYRRQLEKNMDESRDIVLNYYQEKGIAEEEAGRLEEFIDGIVEGYLDGRITPRVLDIFRNAMNYERDVEEAREVGKTEGMNSKIDAVREKKRTETDGLPSPGSSTGTVPPPRPESAIETLLDRMANRRAATDALFVKSK